MTCKWRTTILLFTFYWQVGQPFFCFLMSAITVSGIAVTLMHTMSTYITRNANPNIYITPWSCNVCLVLMLVDWVCCTKSWLCCGCVANNDSMLWTSCYEARVAISLVIHCVCPWWLILMWPSSGTLLFSHLTWGGYGGHFCLAGGSLLWSAVYSADKCEATGVMF